MNPITHSLLPLNLESLHKAVQDFHPNPHRVPFHNLKPFHDSILELRRKNASYATSAELLQQHGAKTSRARVAEYGRIVLAGRKNRRRRKPSKPFMPPASDHKPEVAETKPQTILEVDTFDMGHALHASAWLTAASWAKTRLAHHRDPIGFRSNMNGVETAQLSGVPWKPARLNAASVAAIQSRTQWPFQNLRLTSPFVPFAPVFERAIQCGNLIKSEIGQ